MSPDVASEAEHSCRLMTQLNERKTPTLPFSVEPVSSCTAGSPEASSTSEEDIS